MKILLFSLTDASGTFSLATAAEIFSTSRYLKTFGRTMVLGVIVAVIATFIGYIFAYTITRTNVPCKGFLKTIATLPILSPPFILCLSIIFLFGRQGLITNGLLKITDNDVYGMGSLIVVQVLSFFPIAYMTLSGILSSIDASVEDAACNMGASRWHTFWTVTFPLSLPGIISGCLLVFIQSLEDFSNPATIGGDFTTLSVEVYQTITGSYDMQKGSVLALLMLVPTMLAYLLNKYWVNKRVSSPSRASPPRPASSSMSPISNGPCSLSAWWWPRSSSCSTAQWSLVPSSRPGATTTPSPWTSTPAPCSRAGTACGTPLSWV